jgi:hypothetical protein
MKKCQVEKIKARDRKKKGDINFSIYHINQFLNLAKQKRIEHFVNLKIQSMNL